MADERVEAQREIAATPGTVFGLLCDPHGHVTIDSSGILQSAGGDPVDGVGGTFVVTWIARRSGTCPWESTTSP
jgi:hypothetical protein